MPCSPPARCALRAIYNVLPRHPPMSRWSAPKPQALKAPPFQLSRPVECKAYSIGVSLSAFQLFPLPPPSVLSPRSPVKCAAYFTGPPSPLDASSSSPHPATSDSPPATGPRIPHFAFRIFPNRCALRAAVRNICLWSVLSPQSSAIGRFAATPYLCSSRPSM